MQEFKSGIRFGAEFLHFGLKPDMRRRSILPGFELPRMSSPGGAAELSRDRGEDPDPALGVGQHERPRPGIGGVCREWRHREPTIVRLMTAYSTSTQYRSQDQTPKQTSGKHLVILTYASRLVAAVIFRIGRVKRRSRSWTSLICSQGYRKSERGVPALACHVDPATVGHCDRGCDVEAEPQTISFRVSAAPKRLE